MEKTISSHYRPLIEDEITDIMDALAKSANTIVDKTDSFGVPYHASTDEDWKLSEEWRKLLDDFFEQVCDFAQKHDMPYLVS